MGRLEELLITGIEKWVDNKDKEGAISTINKALIINPRDIRALKILGNIHYSSGEYSEACEYYKAAVEGKPEDNAIRNNLADTYTKLKKFDEAVLEQRRILQNDPSDISAKVGLSNSYLGLNQLDEAIKESLEVIRNGLKTKTNGGWHNLFTKEKIDYQKQVLQRETEINNLSGAYCNLIMATIRKKDYKMYLKYEVQFTLFRLETELTDLLLRLKP